MELTMIGKRFQVVIPKKIRGLLGLREGQSLAVSLEGRRVTLEPVSRDALKKIPRYNERTDEKKAEEFLLKHAGR